MPALTELVKRVVGRASEESGAFDSSLPTDDGQPMPNDRREGIEGLEAMDEAEEASSRQPIGEGRQRWRPDRAWQLPG